MNRSFFPPVFSAFVPLVVVWLFNRSTLKAFQNKLSSPKLGKGFAKE
jgi:hypothetical protein